MSIITPRSKLALCVLEQAQSQDPKAKENFRFLKKLIIGDIERKVFFPLVSGLKEYYFTEKTKRNPSGLIQIYKSDDGLSVQLKVGNQGVMFGFGSNGGFYFGATGVSLRSGDNFWEMREIDKVVDDNFENKIIELLLP